MSLVSGEKILLDARKKGYAIPQFNVLNMEMIDAVISTANETKSPVIVGIVDRHFPDLDVESLIYIVKQKAQESQVPIILHLDHGRSWERVMEAIRLGFTSVMFDGSLLPIEENIKITKDIVHCAHAIGVSVEAEIGHVGSNKGGDKNELTLIEDAVYFVEQTNVDYLAVSIGNVHGHIKNRSLKLNFDILKEIKNQVSIPLVLHGGSDITKEEMDQLITDGISKVNIFSEFGEAYLQGIVDLANSEKIDYLDLVNFGKKKSIEIIREKLEMFHTLGQAKNDKRGIGK